MIRVIIDRSESYQEFLVTGHANYADYGHDIVCAAISTINCMLANMTAAADDYARCEQSAGYSHVYIKGPESERMRAILDTIQTGYEAVAAEYPKYVQIEYQRESQ